MACLTPFDKPLAPVFGLNWAKYDEACRYRGAQDRVSTARIASCDFLALSTTPWFPMPWFLLSWLRIAWLPMSWLPMSWLPTPCLSMSRLPILWLPIPWLHSQADVLRFTWSWGQDLTPELEGFDFALHQNLAASSFLSSLRIWVRRRNLRCSKRGLTWKSEGRWKVRLP